MARVTFKKANDTVTVDYSDPASQAELVQMFQSAGYEKQTDQAAVQGQTQEQRNAGASPTGQPVA